MGSLVKKQAERFLRENQRHRRWLAIFLCLALVVTSGTFAALRMNGRAMDIEGKVLDCQLKVHQHTKDCFDENGELICGQADYVVHTHSAACYDGEGKLVCQIPEREAHVHDDSCYTEEKTLICDQEEAEGHHHTQDCYTKQIGEWICTKEAHEHNELCYDAEGNLICGIEPHQHGDACYEWNEVLTCGQEESEGHTHSDECYKKEKKLTCGELELHEHDGPCYENGVLTCKVPELKEHVHNEECFRDAETDDQLQGEEFESDGKDPGSEVVSGDTADENGEDGGTVSDDTVSGDIVSGDAVSSDTISADTVSGNTDEAEETDEAREFSYEDDQVEINVRAAKKGIVPEDAELSVKPIVQQDVEALREDESVSENEVAEAEELNAKYEEVQKELEASVAKDKEKEIAGFLAYDISFLVDRENEETGEIEKIEVEPDGNVDVSMKFTDAYIPEMPEETTSENKIEKTVSADNVDKKEGLVVDVVHMKEVKDNKTGETKLNAEVLDAYVDKTEDAKVSEVKFTAESFSTFTIAWFDERDSSTPVYSVSINCCTEDGVEIHAKDLEPLELDVNESVAPADAIKPGGSHEAYYSINDTSDKTYYFQSAKCVKKGEDLTADAAYVHNIMIWDGEVVFWSGNDKLSPSEYDIYFLYKKEVEPPVSVNTIDSRSLGVKLYMKNYNFDSGGLISKLQGTYHNGEETPGLVQERLVDGYPVTKNGYELKEWFSGGVEANNLFREDKYELDKSFYYSCFENYAYFDEETKQFTVYNNPASPAQAPTEAVFFNRGNFFPYNQIVGEESPCSNKYDRNGNLLTKDDPAYGKTLYKTDGVDFHFSMYLEAEFMQAQGGLYNGSPMIYEFTGDDDLWVFIDDQLVLDIGGIHDAKSGSINFQTGEVYVDGVKQKSLKERFPDKISGVTFEDYSTHTLKMFYMERNAGDGISGGIPAGASNLRVSFNLPTIGEDQIQVTKQLSNTEQEAYANTEFKFQVYAQKEKEDSNPKNPEFLDEYEVLSKADAYKNFDPEQKVDFDEKGVFKLKPGDTAIFPGIVKTRKYYVKELGIVPNEYDTVSVNGTTITGKDDEGNASGQTTKGYVSETKSVSERRTVVFTNNCTEKNSRKLLIKKILNGDRSTEVKSFDIKVYLEDKTGHLTPYKGAYRLVDDQGKYYKYVNGKLQDVSSSGTGTTENGIIKIVPGYTVEIRGLIAGTDFRVGEILGAEADKYEIVSIAGEENTYESKTISENTPGLDRQLDGSVILEKDAKVIVTNKLKGADPTPCEWKIIKRGTDAGTPRLGGAEFSLISGDGKTVYTGKSEDNTGEIKWYKDNDQNTSINGSDIPYATYVLKETKSPTNYTLSDKEWTIVLSKDGIEIRSGSEGTVIAPTETDSSGGKTEYTFYNTCLYELPSTGGDGIYWYLVSGIVLMMASTLILYKNRRKEVVRK